MKLGMEYLHVLTNKKNESNCIKENSMKKLIFIFLLIVFQASLFANTMYVQSPAAKLTNEPFATASGTTLPQGAMVRKVGEQGLFVKVVYEGKEGWVNKLFLSTNPPSGKVSFGSDIDKSTAVKARARASTFTQTAAARGFTETKSMRTRSSAEDYDFESLSWLEKLNIEEKR